MLSLAGGGKAAAAATVDRTTAGSVERERRDGTLARARRAKGSECVAKEKDENGRGEKTGKEAVVSQMAINGLRRMKRERSGTE
ncbi:hypothetical protein L249_5857 [Ophiocordyceps polyrhachis-furcata BCC 54312]|uniref:Uncharacterized protein n=1 Tax=Ophiocordyceps polyrhachis-furcata BCC 54312 TaxID=1330021 RepID=A0A367L0C7_9HYPO|nr:hypothetical protein L249_5857 [Ophiocordyceps polyrhachis-furcata BCC 54312]